jgi:hypothetical protein
MVETYDAICPVFKIKGEQGIQYMLAMTDVLQEQAEDGEGKELFHKV